MNTREVLVRSVAVCVAVLTYRRSKVVVLRAEQPIISVFTVRNGIPHTA